MENLVFHVDKQLLPLSFIGSYEAGLNRTRIVVKEAFSVLTIIHD